MKIKLDAEQSRLRTVLIGRVLIVTFLMLLWVVFLNNYNITSLYYYSIIPFISFLYAFDHINRRYDAVWTSYTMNKPMIVFIICYLALFNFTFLTINNISFQGKGYDFIGQCVFIMVAGWVSSKYAKIRLYKKNKRNNMK